MKKNPLDIALHFMKFRPRSIFEVRKKLSTKYEEKEIDDVIRVLKKNKLLDDQEFAKMWIRDKNLLHPSGAYLLKIQLKKLGVAAEDIEQALADQNEAELAQKALEMKFRDREIEYEKKVAFLQRRGFSNSIVYKILKSKS